MINIASLLAIVCILLTVGYSQYNKRQSAEQKLVVQHSINSKEELQEKIREVKETNQGLEVQVKHNINTIKNDEEQKEKDLALSKLQSFYESQKQLKRIIDQKTSKYDKELIEKDIQEFKNILNKPYEIFNEKDQKYTLINKQDQKLLIQTLECKKFIEKIINMNNDKDGFNTYDYENVSGIDKKKKINEFIQKSNSDCFNKFKNELMKQYLQPKEISQISKKDIDYKKNSIEHKNIVDLLYNIVLHIEKEQKIYKNSLLLIRMQDQFNTNNKYIDTHSQAEINNFLDILLFEWNQTLKNKLELIDLYH